MNAISHVKRLLELSVTLSSRFTALGIVLLLFLSAGAKEINQVSINFLDDVQAANAVVNDIRNPYFDKLTFMEMESKTGQRLDSSSLNQSREKVRNIYRQATRSFSLQEKDAIGWFISRLHTALAQEYQLLAGLEWNFVKIADGIEWGFPFTLDNTIILSESYCEQIVKAKQKAEIHKSIQTSVLVTVGTTLLHEQVHVFQKMYPDKFDSLYTNIFGFIKTDAIIFPTELNRLLITNPDGTETGWVLPIYRDSQKQYICPRLCFKENEKEFKTAKDLTMIAVWLEKTSPGFKVLTDEHGKPVYQKLSSVKEYAERFPLVGKNFFDLKESGKNERYDLYHPNEISASLFVSMFMYEHFLPRHRNSKENNESIRRELAPFKSWCQSNLN